MKELKVGERVTIECVRTTISKPFICHVRNVSDLQHILFGLGLNSEMEV